MVFKFTQEELQKSQKLNRMKSNLRMRQRKLIGILHSNRFGFRKNPRHQTELRRVAALCVRLDVDLHGLLQAEIVERIMES